MTEPHENRSGVSQHAGVSCPHCLRSNLRIRPANLGREVVCKHCGKSSALSSADESQRHLRLDSTYPHGADSRRGLPRRTEPGRAIEEGEFQRIRDALAAQATRCDAALRQLAESQDQLAQAQNHVHDLQEQLDRAQEKLRQAEGLRDELVGLRSENDRWCTEVEGLRRQATDAVRLEAGLRAELEQSRAQLARIDLGTNDATARELEDDRAERDRLRAELRDREADGPRLGRLTEELEALRSERNRLDADVRAGEVREKQLQARIQEVERLAEEERGPGRGRARVWQEQLAAAGVQLAAGSPPPPARSRNGSDTRLRSWAGSGMSPSSRSNP